MVGQQLSRPVRHSMSTSSVAELTSLAVDIDISEKQRSPVSPRIRTTSQLFALQSVPSATPSSETWRMPFMFKCLGTLRWEDRVILIYLLQCTGYFIAYNQLVLHFMSTLQQLVFPPPLASWLYLNNMFFSEDTRNQSLQ